MQPSRNPSRYWLIFAFIAKCGTILVIISASIMMMIPDHLLYRTPKPPTTVGDAIDRVLHSDDIRAIIQSHAFLMADGDAGCEIERSIACGVGKERRLFSLFLILGHLSGDRMNRLIASELQNQSEFGFIVHRALADTDIQSRISDNNIDIMIRCIEGNLKFGDASYRAMHERSLMTLRDIRLQRHNNNPETQRNKEPQ